MSLDVARVRGLYPTLGAGIAHLDGPYSALQPETVIRAIITTLRRSPTQPGSRSARSLAAARSVQAARAAVADLVGVTADSVMLGANLPTLIARFASLLSADWQLADEIVLDRLEHEANIQPWLTAARANGVTVRWAEVDLETGELPDWQYDRLISRRTRLVTIPLANPMTGAVPDVRAIADRAHAIGAIVLVDAGAALPHLPIDLAELGADLLGLSAASFGGPTVAAMVARPGLLLELDSGDGQPERFEVGALPVELLDGLTAAVEHVADLDDSTQGTRRERVLAALAAVGPHEHRLYLQLDRALRAIKGVTVIGTSTERIPVLAFTVEGHPPGQVGDFLAGRGVSVWTGASGLTQLSQALGLDELGGAVLVGLMPHTTRPEIDKLVAALKDFVGGS